MVGGKGASIDIVGSKIPYASSAVELDCHHHHHELPTARYGRLELDASLQMEGGFQIPGFLPERGFSSKLHRHHVQDLSALLLSEQNFPLRLRGT